MEKYTNALYPDKINDLVDNEGNLNAEAISSATQNKANLVNGKVPANELPSYVDDVIECEDLQHFPQEGEEGKVYVALDTGFTYRWGGSVYVQIGGQDLSQYSTTAEVQEMIDSAVNGLLEEEF